MTDRTAELPGRDAHDAHAEPKGGFQDRVGAWMVACFGRDVAADGVERNHRFLEEAIELVQALGCTASEAHQLVDYVFGRERGDPAQEVGGVMLTLAGLCQANGLAMADSGEAELTRCWDKIAAIRAKQAAKPRHSPFPQATDGDPLRARIAVLEQACGAAAAAMMLDMNAEQIAAAHENSAFALCCRAVGMDPVNEPERLITLIEDIRRRGPQGG